MSMISVQNITFGYSKKKAPIFKDLSLELNCGHIYGLLGKNGEGKTTLMKLMSGLRFAQCGTVETLGYPAPFRNPNMLKDIYFLSEEMYVPDVTIEEYITAFSPFYPNFSQEKMQNCLAQFEMTDVKQKMTKMSHGQKKKVLISFALATNTKLIFMDEPTNGLDIPSKSMFRKVMVSAADDDRLFIISTHQVRDLYSLIDTIIILDGGEILLNAGTDEITDKLLFKVVDSVEEAQDALYSEDSLRGVYSVFENKEHIENKLDIELLFNAVLCEKQRVKEIFNLKK